MREEEKERGMDTLNGEGKIKGKGGKKRDRIVVRKKGNGT
jgi:hypothetical protein